MKFLHTVTGSVTLELINYFLPHEHVVLDLSVNDDKDKNHFDCREILKRIIPYLNDAKSKGISAIGECSPLNVGRRADVMKEASDETGVLITAATGMYCDPWIPSCVNDKSSMDLAKLFIKELTVGMDNTDVKAGFIKVGVFKDEPTDKEKKVMEAACYASKETGCAILAHAMNRKSVDGHIKILKDTKCNYDRYIWAHAHRECNIDYHYRILELGCNIQYDGIGLNDSDDLLVINLIKSMQDKGFKDKILISQDRGWYNPSKPNGGEFRLYTYMVNCFIPKMIDKGIDKEYVKLLLRDNPFNALSQTT